MRDELSLILAEAIDFNNRHGMGFGEAFQAAQAALDSDRPLDGYYHADMVAEGLLPLEYERLFACAAKAWVFGGMGSWNDAWFEGADQDTYQRISDKMFAAIIDALLTATNASAPSLPRA